MVGGQTFSRTSGQVQATESPKFQDMLGRGEDVGKNSLGRAGNLFTAPFCHLTAFYCRVYILACFFCCDFAHNKDMYRAFLFLWFPAPVSIVVLEYRQCFLYSTYRKSPSTACPLMVSAATPPSALRPLHRSHRPRAALSPRSTPSEACD